MGRRIRATSLLLAVIAVGTAGCGSGDDGHDRADYVDILSGGVEGITDQESTCMSEATVDVIGVDALEEAGAYDKVAENPDGSLSDFGVTLSDEQKSTFFRELNGCKDMRDLFEETLVSSGGLTPELAECVVGKVDDPTFERIIVTSFTDGDDALDDDADLTSVFQTATAECAAEATP